MSSDDIAIAYYRDIREKSKSNLMPHAHFSPPASRIYAGAIYYKSSENGYLRNKMLKNRKIRELQSATPKTVAEFLE